MKDENQMSWPSFWHRHLPSLSQKTKMALAGAAALVASFGYTVDYGNDRHNELCGSFQTEVTSEADTDSKPMVCAREPSMFEAVGYAIYGIEIAAANATSSSETTEAAND
jgi:hypothetical protein